MKIVYLDNENVTKVDPAVLKAVNERYTTNFGVPGGEFGHKYEEEASNAIWKAREAVARKINAEPDEIIFTSGVTESNNLAIKGSVFYFSRRKGKAKIVTSKIERKCIINS
ncbi:MAG: aminotransferase class V-fold PLP-dependent enzyme, partial [Thermoplasmata archaeon]